MDDMVRQAMAKWPNVPHCYGWLGLDARGHWYMRDDRAQAAGPFSQADGGNPVSKGSQLRHDKLIDFIQRNYGVDERGQWYFQNGPQRVYVELEVAPWVWRLDAHLAVTAHSGQPAQPLECLVDELGRVFLLCQLNGSRVPGLVHTQDVALAAQAIEQELWPLAEITFADLVARFGFERSPQRHQPSSASMKKAGH